MKKAKWFSRHRPTADQLSGAARMGYVIESIEEGIAAGGRNMVEQPDVWAASDYCTGAVVFGVFPAPLRSLWLEGPDLAPQKAFESWNVMRSKDGEKPSFEHKSWVRVR